jgi:hypothetical protein
MNTNATLLIAAQFAMVLLTFVVGARLLFCRVSEMRRKRIHPQSAATSSQMSARLENVQAADNFRNLFEIPVLFYALCASALALHQVPSWLAAGAWLFVALRALHSLIHCTYNKVFHRLAAFVAGFGVLIWLWVSFLLHVLNATAG